MGKSKDNKYYFTDDTEEAIIKYNERITPCCGSTYTEHRERIPNSKKRNIWYECDKCNKILSIDELEYKLTQSERDKLYREEIDFPFLKLAECILYDGHSYNISSNPQVIKRDIVAFLVSKIDRFDPSRGYKAFSFFNRVAKNYLIYTSIQNTKIGNTHTYIDTLDTQNKGRVLYEIYKKMDKTYDKQTEELAKSILNKLKNRLSDDMEIIFKNNKDRKVAWGIVELLNHHRDIVEIYNKKALYVILREYSHEPTIRISRVVKKIKGIYEKIKNEERNLL